MDDLRSVLVGALERYLLPPRKLLSEGLVALASPGYVRPELIDRDVVALDERVVLHEERVVLRRVGARLCVEVAQPPEDLEPDGVFVEVLRICDELAQPRVEVLASVLQSDEPRHVVDACAEVVQFVVGHVEVLGQLLRRALDAVAQAHVTDGRVRGHAE